MLSKGLPEHIYEYQTGQLDIAGTVFKAAPIPRAGGARQGLQLFAGAVFMACQKPESIGEVWFGVIRRVLKIPQCGSTADRPMSTLVWADWFKQIPTNAADPIKARTHKRLQVPMVMKTFDKATDALWDARLVAPVHLTLVPSLDGDERYWVLSRDAKVWELAHPMWSPDPKGSMGLDYKVQRRDR